MTIILSSLNLKGGVGKTTISVNFAAYCANAGLKTLLIDLDPQTNATFSTIGVSEWETHAKTNGTIADLFGARNHSTAEGKIKTVQQVLYKDALPGVDLIPSHLEMFTIDLDLSQATAREKKLSKAIKPIIGDYDVIICDCPPNLTLPTQNALAISTHFIVPVSLDFLSALGIGLLLSRVNELAEELENKIECAGIVISRVGRKAEHRESTQAAIRASFKDHVLTGVIADRVAVSKSAETRTSIFDGGDKKAINEFSTVFDELFERLDIEYEGE